MTAARSALFSVSARNSPGVMRLKPKRASMTNWRHHASGRSTAPEISSSEKSGPDRPSGLASVFATRRQSASMPPPSVSASSKAFRRWGDEAEANLRYRVIGRLPVCLQCDAIGEFSGYAIATGADVANLPAGKPDADSDGDPEGGEKDGGEAGGEGVRHAVVTE